MQNRLLLSVIILCFFQTGSFAQKKVLGIPEAFKRPVDDNYSGKSINNTGDQSITTEWWVMSDRADNPIYSKADTTSKEVGIAPFKDYYLVVKNATDWVEIAEYQNVENCKPTDKLEVLGWMPKNKLLLWPAALRDPVTKIERKAFLLNNKKDVLKSLQSRATGAEGINYKNIFDAPNGDKMEDTQIYQFYFVYKKVKGQFAEWYLLGSDSRFPFASRAQKGIIGWVNTKDLTTWNTNLCMEPNFEPEAYKERKANENIRVRTFNNQDALRGVSTNYSGNMNEVYMNASDGSDVVGFLPGEKAKSNPMRHKGKVMRFPYLSQDVIGGTPYFITGQIGSLPVGTNEKGFQQSMPEIELGELNGALVQMQRSLEEYNLFFVIDGTKEMGRYKESLISSLQRLSENPNLNEPGRVVRYGALFYRKLGNGSMEFELIEPTVESSEFITSVRGIEFANAFGADVSYAQGTLLKQGVKRGLRAANFSESAMNNLIILGTEGDVSFNTNNNTPPEYQVSDEELVGIKNDLAKLRVSVHSIQFANTNVPADRAFRGFTFSEVILEAAKTELNIKRSYEETKVILEKGKVQEPNPAKAKGYNSNKISSYKTGYNFYPDKGGVLSADTISKYLNLIVNKYTQERTLEIEIMRKLIRGLEAYDQGSFSEQFGISSGTVNDITFKAITEVIEKSGVSIETILQTFDQKLDLFQEVYIPVQPNGANYPSCKFVVFMTDEHLVDYRNALRTGLNACNDNNAGTTQKRDAVQEMLERMLEVFTGDTKLDEKFNDIDPDEYATKVKGIEDILSMETPLMKNLNDVQNSKKVSNDELEEIIDRCQRVYDELKEISSAREENQDFVLKTVNSKYFWLTLDQIY